MSRRLTNNLRLAGELAAERRPIWRREPAALRLGFTVPVDADQVIRLFAVVGRALAWFHWKTYLSVEHASDSLMLTPFGEHFFDRIFAMNARERVRCNLGTGAVGYQRVQAEGKVQLTL